MSESHHIEYKMQLTDKFEKEVVAFLNYNGAGQIYLGIANDGISVGIKDVDGDALKLKDRLKNNI